MPITTPPIATTKADVLNREFLEVRAKILEIAAALDRLDRVPGDVTGDLRITRLRDGLTALQSPAPGRAAVVQTIFSLAYDPQWRTALAVDAARSS